jgi:hypothetical protein
MKVKGRSWIIIIVEMIPSTEEERNDGIAQSESAEIRTNLLNMFTK